MKTSRRYHSLDFWLRQRHGEKVQKIPLDAQSACPNRDGSLGREGCTFCNAIGSGSGLGHLPLPEQWDYWRKRFAASDRLKHTRFFLAYLQAFSNTYGSLNRLKSLLLACAPLPGLLGLCIGTRPDCLDEEKIALLAALDLPEIWLELGAQSSRDDSLSRIRRGHNSATTAKAVALANQYGIKSCLHLMAGLPGESPQDFLNSVEWAAELGAKGVKLHSLYVCENTALAQDWQKGLYQPQEQAEYVELVAEALQRLPSSLVIHRLTGDPAPGELLAPAWASQKGKTILALDQMLEQKDLWQGKKADVPLANPWPAPTSANQSPLSSKAAKAAKAAKRQRTAG